MTPRPLIVLRAAEKYERDFMCNGCDGQSTHVLETGRRFGSGSSGSLYRMCDDCLRQLKVSVLSYALDVTALCRCPCPECIDSKHEVSE